MRCEKKCLLVALAMLIFFMVSILECRATVITPPTKIELDGGRESNGIWICGSWASTFAMDEADSIVGSVILPANTTKEYENGTKIYTKKTVEIQLTPQKAYYKIPLKLMEIDDRIVAPAVYYGNMIAGTTVGYDKSKGINPTVVNTYTLAEHGWQKYTIFDVKAIVNGQVVGQASLNTEKGTKDISIPTTNGTILIKNLGRLEGDYTEPQIPSDVVIFDSRYIYSGDALRYIRYDHGRTYHYWITDKQNVAYVEDTEAFSAYWWGPSRWNPNAGIDNEVKNTPAPYTKPGGTGYDIIASTKGWKEQDNPTFLGIQIGSGRMPVEPNIFPENGTDSLIEYLNMKTSGGNIAKTWMSGYNWNLEYQNGQPSAVIVELPWGAYSGAPVVTCFIPSELADTWTYHPPIANVKIVKAYWLNGSEIKDNATCRLELYQNSTVTSSATILAETSDRAAVSPRSSTITMAPNTTTTMDFVVTNLGVTEKENDLPGTVSFRMLRTWDGLQTDNATLSFILKKQVVPEDITVATIRKGDVVDDNAKPIPEYGIPYVTIVAIVCATIAFLGVSTLFYKSKAINKKDVRTTLTTFGKLGKEGAKEGLNLGKSVWRSSATIRRLCGCAVGMAMMAVAYFWASFFGTVQLSAIAVPGAILLVGFGALIFVDCFKKIFSC